MLEKAVGMCIGRGFWGEHCNVHQEGCLGRTLGCASGGMFGKDGGDVHQDRGFGMCAQWSCQPLQKELQQDCVLQRFALPLPGVWRREEYFICTTGFKWWLLNHYWRLVVGSMF